MKTLIKVSDLLTAAGANLDAPSTAPGANGTNGETYRSSDIVIVIVIEYKNVQFEKDKFAYVYLPRVIDGMGTNTRQSRVCINQMGRTY